MSVPARVWPARPLLVLTAVVLLAHALVLSGACTQVFPGESAPARLVFATRTLPTWADLPAPEPRRAPDPLFGSVPPRSETATGSVRRALPAVLPDRDAAAPATQHTPAEAVAPERPAPLAAPPGPARTPAAAAVAVHVPASARVRYKVSALARGIPVNGQGELSWRNDGTEYEAQMQVSALFMPTRTQRSTGHLTTEGIEPTRFSDRTRSEEAAHFERDKGKIVFSANRPDVALLPGAQDRLTVLLQLGALVAGDPKRYAAGSSITLQTASTRDADLWKFTVEGVEDLQLPGGRLQTLRLQRAPRFEFDQKVELWLAPGQDYLPVRLRLTQPNGDSVDQEWISTERG